ncbi:MAG: hypothetical protein AB1742_03195 [bacterium]
MHTLSLAVHKYVYERLNVQKKVEHWRKRWHLMATALIEDGEFSKRVPTEEFMAMGEKSFNSYTYTRFLDLVERYGLITGGRADCVEGVNLATIWTTFYHLPEDILTLAPEKLWVRKYDCTAGWTIPPFCPWCQAMKSAILRVINPELRFVWTMAGGLGHRCGGGSVSEGYYVLGDPGKTGEGEKLTTAHTFEPEYLAYYDFFQREFGFRREPHPEAHRDGSARHTPLERVRRFVTDIASDDRLDLEEFVLNSLCMQVSLFDAIRGRLGEDEAIRVYKRAAGNFWTARLAEIIKDVPLMQGEKADCVEASHLFFIESHFNGEPEERVEMEEKRVTTRKFHCKWSGFQPPMCDQCRSMRSAGLRLINPALSFRYTKCMGLGDDFCEGVYETGGSDAECILKRRFPGMDEKFKPVDVTIL